MVVLLLSWPVVWPAVRHVPLPARWLPTPPPASVPTSHAHTKNHAAPRPLPPRTPAKTTTKNRSDKELAKFEAFLNKEECLEIGAIVRPRARLAYPMDRHKSWEGVYVLYTYAAKRPTAKAVQLLLSRPEAGSEDKLMRHITFLKY